MRKVVSILLTICVGNTWATLSSITSDATELVANNAFPSAQEICVMRYGDKYAIDLITQAACIDAYKHLRQQIVVPGWQVHRFNCDHENVSGINVHPGNFVMYHPKERVAIIAFKGTEGKVSPLSHDWVNARIEMHQASEDIDNTYYLSGKLGEFFQEEGNAYLHKGFKIMAISSQGEVFKILEKLRSDHNINLQETKFILTGHSHGGATATLFACALFQYLWLQNNYDRNISIITFGAPKFCNKAAANLMEKKLAGAKDDIELGELIRFANSSWMLQDPVTYVPMPFLLPIMRMFNRELAHFAAVTLACIGLYAFYTACVVTWEELIQSDYLDGLKAAFIKLSGGAILSFFTPPCFIIRHGFPQMLGALPQRLQKLARDEVISSAFDSFAQFFTFSFGIIALNIFAIHYFMFCSVAARTMMNIILPNFINSVVSRGLKLFESFCWYFSVFRVIGKNMRFDVDYVHINSHVVNLYGAGASRSALQYRNNCYKDGLHRFAMKLSQYLRPEIE